MRALSYKYICEDCVFETYSTSEALEHIKETGFTHALKRKIINEEDDND